MKIFALFAFISAACSGGTSIGAFILKSPNRSTVAVVGGEIEIAWSFSPLVSVIPSSISMFLAKTGPETLSFTSPVKTIPDYSLASGNETFWTVSNLNDGQYQMRIGITDRDPLLSSTACLQDGEAYGASSSVFKIVNSVDFPKPKKSIYGPLKSGESSYSRLRYLVGTLLLMVNL
jgi:hypothetical protein